MTENETRVILKAELKHHPETSIFYEALSKAIEILEELQQYRAIGTPEECRAAVEKQKEKKPIRNDKCTCPSCGTHNELFKKRRNTVAHDIVYCWHCGQAVDIDRLE